MSRLTRRQLLLGALAATFGTSHARPPAVAPYVGRADVEAFVDSLAAEHGIPRGWLEHVLATARRSTQAERLVTPSLTPPPRDWLRYQAQALDENRLRDAVAYLQANRRTLTRALDDFGVPAEIVVAIIGIETRFGRVMGRFRTLDVLMTLAFDYPRRADFYRDELGHFLALGHLGRINVLKQTGSFAGAIGLPQFMPSSIRRFALDYDGDGQIDLVHSSPDAIGSVAHYLHRQGWQRDRPVMFDATANEAIADQLGRGIVAARSWAEVADLGVRIDGYLPPDAQVVLLDLPYLQDDGTANVEYRIGTVNLATILHYNRSYFYGAAVAEFAATLRGQMAPEARADVDGTGARLAAASATVKGIAG
jgi:membrane-bound lytic murein transglycosylase B